MTIEVTQEDREAAAKFEEMAWPGSHAVWTAMVEQAFARHRIAAYEKGQGGCWAAGRGAGALTTEPTRKSAS